jgi:DNA-binding PadR family transcriptional regulator
LSKEDLLSGFLLELRRGTIILCVLAKLNTPTYGYGLIAELAGSGITVEANTLYPLLRRLEGQGLLESTWNTEGTKPRKYYYTTEDGKAILGELRKHWQKTVTSVSTLWEEHYET